jgi:hypothetical protein
MVSLGQHVLTFLGHLKVILNMRSFFGCLQYVYFIVVFIKLHFMLLMFVLVGILSTYALDYCCFVLFVRLL